MSSQLPPRPEFKQQSTKIAPPTRGLKIKNKDSDKRAEQRQVEESQKQHFEENADKTVSVYHEKHKRVLDIVSSCINMFNDKTLSQNKGIIGTDLEKEARQELLNIVIELNNDPMEEKEGKGSNIAIQLMCKVLLSQRDRLNQLEYDLARLKAENKK